MDILAVVFMLVIISAMIKPCSKLRLWWCILFIIYLLLLAFITVISRRDIQQSVVVREIRFHYVFLSRPDAGLPWEDVANVILFIPMGVFLYGLAAGKIHWFGCVAVIAFYSAAIEFSQYILQCGFCDINDFMNNVLGGVVGYILCCGVFKLVSWVRMTQGARPY